MGTKVAEWGQPNIVFERYKYVQTGFYMLAFNAPIVALALNSGFGFASMFFFLAISQYVAMFSSARKDRLLKPLYQTVTDEDAVKATVSFSYRETIYGDDRGIIRIEDGLLRFTGLLTEFAIDSSRLNPTGEWKQANTRSHVSFEVQDDQERKITVKISEVTRLRDPNKGFDFESFLKRLQNWRMAEPKTDNEVMLPPCSVSPDALPSKLFITISCSVAIASGLVYLLFSELSSYQIEHPKENIILTAFGLGLVGLGVGLAIGNRRTRLKLQKLFEA